MMLSSREDGLSLLELLVVIALIAIIGGLAAPNIVTWADRTVPERDMAQIKYMIDYAKRQSVAQSKTYFLKSTAQNNLTLYKSFSDNPTNNCALTAFGACDTCGTFDDAFDPTGTGTIFESTLATNHDGNGSPGPANTFNNQDGLLCFFADGTSSSGGFQVTFADYGQRIDVWITGAYNSWSLINNDWEERN